MAVRRNQIVVLIGWLAQLWLGLAVQAADPSYVREVQPLMRKYCGGCHNEADKEGDFSVSNFEALSKGTPDGPVLKAGDVAASRLLRLIRGQDEPKMPPEEEAQPTAKEIQTIEAWIAAGAKNDASMIPLDEQIATPALKRDDDAASYITAMIDGSDQLVAVARLGKCELRDVNAWQVTSEIPVAGKINQLRVSPSGKYLLIAGGIAGVGGQVQIIDLATRMKVGSVQGHSDAIYCAAMSPDDRWLCTGSYDRNAILWDCNNRKRFVSSMATTVPSTISISTTKARCWLLLAPIKQSNFGDCAMARGSIRSANPKAKCCVCDSCPTAVV